MNIQNVAVLGAGAVGSYFIDCLHEKLGEHLWVIASKDRKTRLEKKGLVVNGNKLPLHVKTPLEARGADLLIVTVKYGALKSARKDADKIVNDHTMVLSPMNGIDSEEFLAKKIGMEHIMYSYMKISSERDGNKIKFDPLTTGGLYFGETDPDASDKRIRALVDLFKGTDLHYHICDDIILGIWEKFATNISLNLPQAMVGCANEAYGKSEYVADLSLKLRHEVVEIANAKGIKLKDLDDSTKDSSSLQPLARFSTLQDLDAGRHTEIDMFSGAIIKMGQEMNIPVPYNEFAYDMIKALEQKNDGVFRA